MEDSRLVLKMTVRYSEVDSMQIVHNSNYPVYFEEARTALLNHIGCPYEKIEEEGFTMPLSKLNFDFKVPLVFAEEFTIKIGLGELRPFSVRFDYEILNSEGKMSCTGSSLNVCIDKNRGRICRLPAWMSEPLLAHFGGQLELKSDLK